MFRSRDTNVMVSQNRACWGVTSRRTLLFMTLLSSSSGDFEPERPPQLPSLETSQKVQLELILPIFSSNNLWLTSNPTANCWLVLVRTSPGEVLAPHRRGPGLREYMALFGLQETWLNVLWSELVFLCSSVLAAACVFVRAGERPPSGLRILSRRPDSPPGSFTLCSSQRLQVSRCGWMACCPVMDVMAAITWSSVGPPYVVILSTKLGPSGCDEAQTCLMSNVLNKAWSVWYGDKYVWQMGVHQRHTGNCGHPAALVSSHSLLLKSLLSKTYCPTCSQWNLLCHRYVWGQQRSTWLFVLLKFSSRCYVCWQESKLRLFMT